MGSMACLGWRPAPAVLSSSPPPGVSETGKLLVRDNAIILSIEYVRLIITADKVLIPREGYEHNPLRCMERAHSLRLLGRGRGGRLYLGR